MESSSELDTTGSRLRPTLSRAGLKIAVVERNPHIGGGSFTGALARVIEACGGSVIAGADVKEVVVRNSRAAAVRLADGRTVEASPFIASAIDAPTTMRMVGEDLFPEDVRRSSTAGTGAITAW
jgi:phytoene dehydrogenase-like protein